MHVIKYNTLYGEGAGKQIIQLETSFLEFTKEASSEKK